MKKNPFMSEKHENNTGKREIVSLKIYSVHIANIKSKKWMHNVYKTHLLYVWLLLSRKS